MGVEAREPETGEGLLDSDGVRILLEPVCRKTLLMKMYGAGREGGGKTWPCGHRPPHRAERCHCNLVWRRDFLVQSYVPLQRFVKGVPEWERRWVRVVGVATLLAWRRGDCSVCMWLERGVELWGARGVTVAAHFFFDSGLRGRRHAGHEVRRG